MAGFALNDNDPREAEWAERIIEAVSSVVVESAPAAEESPRLHKAYSTNDPALPAIMAIVVPAQIEALVPDIVERALAKLAA